MNQSVIFVLLLRTCIGAQTRPPFFFLVFGRRGRITARGATHGTVDKVSCSRYPSVRRGGVERACRATGVSTMGDEVSSRVLSPISQRHILAARETGELAHTRPPPLGARLPVFGIFPVVDPGCGGHDSPTFIRRSPAWCRRVLREWRAVRSTSALTTSRVIASEPRTPIGARLEKGLWKAGGIDSIWVGEGE